MTRENIIKELEACEDTHEVADLCLKYQREVERIGRDLMEMISLKEDAENRVKELEHALREREWLWGGNGPQYCPDCHGNIDSGHRENCRFEVTMNRIKNNG